MNSAPVVPYGRNALLVNAAAVVLGLVSAVCYRYIPDPTGTVFAIMTAIACCVNWFWSIILAVRSLRREDRHRCAWIVMIASAAEITLPCLLPWLHIFRLLPRFLEETESYWIFARFISSYGLPVFVPFLTIGTAAAIALSGWITRRDEGRWTPRRRRWAVYPFLAMIFLVLPWPLFLFCAAWGGNDWKMEAAQSMPNLVKDGVAWCVYSQSSKSLRAIHDKLISKKLISRSHAAWVANQQLKEFASNPSQKLVEEMAQLLASFLLEKEQGNAVLKALTAATVSSRASYAPGKPATFIVKRHFGFHFNGKVMIRYRARLGDTTNDNVIDRRFGQGGTGLSSSPETIQTERLAHAGPQRATITCTSEIYMSRESSMIMYECRTDTPIDFEAVSDGTEEKINLVSGPGLDSAMQSAFYLSTSGGASSPPAEGGDRVEFQFAMVPGYDRLPENVAFKILFQDQNGKKTLLSSFVARSGASGMVPLDVRSLAKKEGSYSGTLILEPYPDEAIPHPDIKQIWDGTIKKPFTFTVRKK